MTKHTFAAALLTAAALAPAALAQDKQWGEAWFEIFKLAPGRQEQFMRNVAQSDEVRKAGGLAPLKLYIHEDGADWDVLIFKIVGESAVTPAQKAAMDAKREELGLPEGPAYFVRLRENVASHTDTKTIGPVAAADWLAKLDAWRAAHPAKPASAAKR